MVCHSLSLMCVMSIEQGDCWLTNSVKNPNAQVVQCSIHIEAKILCSRSPIEMQMAVAIMEADIESVAHHFRFIPKGIGVRIGALFADV